MGYTAYGASPTTHRKGKVMINISTSTHLGRRFKPAYSENIYTVFLCLVFKQGVETAYGNIFKSLCKMMVLNHIACSKCFKTDGVMLRNKFMCNFVEKIVPLIRNSFMLPCESYSCTFSILGTFGFMRKGTLQSFDFLDRTFQIFMVRYFRTIGKNGKRFDTKVNSNRFAFADWFCLCILFVHFYKYGNEIFASRSPCDNGCLVKSVVIQEATTTEMLCYKRLLPLCWVNPIFVRLVFHITKVQNNLEISKEMSKKIRNSSTQSKELWDFLLILFKSSTVIFNNHKVQHNLHAL